MSRTTRSSDSNERLLTEWRLAMAGVRQVVPQEVLELLEVEELSEMWSGSGIDDVQLLRWQTKTHFAESLGEELKTWFW